MTFVTYLGYPPLSLNSTEVYYGVWTTSLSHHLCNLQRQTILMLW